MLANSTNDGNVGEGDTEPDDAQGEEPPRNWYFMTAFAGALVLIGAATVFYHFEEDWSWVDSFDFSTIAVTTVGFGDLTPTTDISKLVTVFYVFTGISLIAAVLNERLKRRTERRVAKRQWR